MEKHWTEKMFIDAAPFFSADLELRIERAREEVKSILTIFKEFKVPANGLILDLCCGIGRHSVALAEEGYEVVGVDISHYFIDKAKEYSENQNVSHLCDFVVGDMRQIAEVLNSHRESFDAVINMYTSVGYYDEETDGRVLGQLHSLTSNGGILIVETAPRDSMIKRMKPYQVVDLGGELVLIEESRFDIDTSRIDSVWRYYRREGEDLRHYKTVETSHRLYSLHEFRMMSEQAGWKYGTSYGGFDLEPFTLEARSMIFVAQKP